MRSSHRKVLGLLVCSAALAGCGSRSGHFPGDGGVLAQDGISPRRDGPAPRRDGPRRDGPRRDGPRRDGPIVRDAAHPDSCLPIPASAVSGYYTGAWKGAHACPGDVPNTLSGQLSFDLLASGTTSFSVFGKMNGIIESGPGSPGVPFFGTVEGSMSCTALTAKLEIWVAGASSYAGTMSGTFTSKPPIGFPSGSWQVFNVNGASCKTAGSWTARQ